MPPNPDKDDSAYLLDMWRASHAVLGFVAGKQFEYYEQDLLLRSGVERQIEIVGEAARQISADFRKAHTEIPWRPIMAQRHVLAHEYGEIAHDRIWRVATVHLPGLIEQLRPLIVQSQQVDSRGHHG